MHYDTSNSNNLLYLPYFHLGGPRIARPSSQGILSYANNGDTGVYARFGGETLQEYMQDTENVTSILPFTNINGAHNFVYVYITFKIYFVDPGSSGIANYTERVGHPLHVDISGGGQAMLLIGKPLNPSADSPPSEADFGYFIVRDHIGATSSGAIVDPVMADHSGGNHLTTSWQRVYPSDRIYSRYLTYFMRFENFRTTGLVRTYMDGRRMNDADANDYQSRGHDGWHPNLGDISGAFNNASGLWRVGSRFKMVEIRTFSSASAASFDDINRIGAEMSKKWNGGTHNWREVNDIGSSDPVQNYTGVTPYLNV